MVKWSRPAKIDLKQIHDYIARDSLTPEEFESGTSLVSDYIGRGEIVYSA